MSYSSYYCCLCQETIYPFEVEFHIVCDIAIAKVGKNGCERFEVPSPNNYNWHICLLSIICVAYTYDNYSLTDPNNYDRVIFAADNFVDLLSELESNYLGTT